MDVAFAKPEENFNRVIKLMEQALKESPDILVLPETLNVGFFPKEGLSELADVDGKKTKEVFGQFAKKRNVNIVAGSVANKKGNHIYNTGKWCCDCGDEGTAFYLGDKISSLK